MHLGHCRNCGRKRFNGKRRSCSCYKGRGRHPWRGDEAEMAMRVRVRKPRPVILPPDTEDDEPTAEELERIIAEQSKCLPAWWQRMNQQMGLDPNYV